MMDSAAHYCKGAQNGIPEHRLKMSVERWTFLEKKDDPRRSDHQTILTILKINQTILNQTILNWKGERLTHSEKSKATIFLEDPPPTKEGVSLDSPQTLPLCHAPPPDLFLT